MNQNKKIPIPVYDVLNEFKNVMPDELPTRLPPMRENQQSIDFVSRANLTNLPHYRMNLEESDILQWIVDDLPEKWPIHMNMSPCVVPSHLTPKKDDF